MPQSVPQREETGQEERDHFSFWWFNLALAGQLAVMLGLFAWLLPEVWQAQWSRPGLVIVTGLVCHFFCAMFEGFFHRYILHRGWIRALAPLARKHRRHHALTPAVLEPAEPSEADTMSILNRHQEESATFPPYAFIAFQSFFMIAWLLVQWAIPNWPIVIGGMLAVTVSYGGYENLHAAQHLSYQRYWQRWIGYPILGRWLERLLRHHLGHHAYNGVNEAIFGFCSLAIWDWLFGTLVLAPLPDEGVRLSVTTCPRPRWPIPLLDALAKDAERHLNRSTGHRNLTAKSDPPGDS